MKTEEIRDGLRRLRGETPSGRMWFHAADHGGWVDLNGDDQQPRPDNWRRRQARKPIMDILTGN